MNENKCDLCGIYFFGFNIPYKIISPAGYTMVVCLSCEEKYKESIRKNNDNGNITVKIINKG